MEKAEIGFFFEYDGKVIQLPVNPEKLEITSDANNKTSEIVKLGEINILKKRKLTSVKFSSFFPKEDWFPAVQTTGQFEDCDFYKKFFSKIMKAKKPVRFVITGIDIDSFFGTDKLVSVEKFDFYHQAGDYEDTYYDIELKQYVDYSVQEIKKINTSTGNTKNKGETTGGTKKPSKITKGCTVIVNGTLYRDSLGNGPGATEKNAVRKINLILNGRKCPYHVTTLSGGWRGWVKKESVKLK